MNKIPLFSVFEESWQILKDKVLEMLVAGAVLIIIGNILTAFSMPLSFLRATFAPGTPGQNNTVFFSLLAIEVLISLVSALVSFWLMTGTINFFLKIIRKEEYSYKDLFLFDVKKILTLLGFIITVDVVTIVYILALSVIIGLGVAAFASQSSMGLIVILTAGILAVAAALPVIAACICISQSPFLIIDGKAGVFSSMMDSFKIMKSRIFEYFILVVASYFIYIVAVLITCCLGIFIALPWLLLVLTIYYNRLIQLELPPPPPPAQEPKGLSSDEIPPVS